MKQLALLLALFLFSCGARTVNKEQKKTDSIAKVTTVVKTDSISSETKKINFDVTTDDICIEPVDTTKPIEITNNEGKVTKYKNARLSHRKRQDNTIVVQDKIVAKIVIDSTTNEIEIKKVDNSKIVYKEQFNWSTFILQLWWIWLLIIIVCYLAYRYYKGFLKFPSL